jgi:hypothetical protein
MPAKSYLEDQGRVRFVMKVGFVLGVLAAASVGCGNQSNAVAPTGLSTAASGAATAAKPSSDTAVTTTIADSMNGVALHVRSDGAGPYLNSSPTQSLILGVTGDWEITTYTIGHKGDIPGPRSVFFDLTEPVAPGNPPPPFQAALQQAHLIAKCSVAGVNVLKIAAGTTVSCPGDFRFDLANGSAYRLSYSPGNFPEVNRFAITCQTADSKGCNHWTLATDGTALTGGDPNPKGVQQLVQIDPGSGDIIATLGDYYISFFITLTR